MDMHKQLYMDSCAEKASQHVGLLPVRVWNMHILAFLRYYRSWKQARLSKLQANRASPSSP